MATGLFTQPLAPSRQRGLVLSLLLLFAALSLQYLHKVGDEKRSAILRWKPQIHQLPAVNIYERFTYPNPPIMALLLKPLIELPPLAASLTWFYLKVGMALVSIVWAFRLVETPGRAFPFWAAALAVILSLRPILGDLSHGNVNLFILFLVMAALYAFRRGQDLTSGVLLALAIACKVTPALFVPYWLWKRAWRALAGCALGLVLFLLLVPGLFLGMGRNVELLRSWYDGMVRPYVSAGEVTTDHPNQSLPGLVYRWLTPSPSSYDKGAPQDYVNIAAVDPARLRGLIKGCMAAFAALVVWSCRTPTQPRQNWRLAAEFSLVLVGMLLFSERTWKHHCVTLLLPFTVLLYYLATEPAGVRLRAYLATTLAAVALLMASTSTGWLEEWDRTAKQAQADGAYVWANLLLIAALVVVLRRQSLALAADLPPGKLELAALFLDDLPRPR
jgi:hypothetical protein